MEVHFHQVEQKRAIMQAHSRKRIRDTHRINIHDKLIPEELREKAQLNAIAYAPLTAAGIAFGWRRSRITWKVRCPGGNPELGTWALLSILEVPQGSSPALVQRAAKLAEQRALAVPTRRPRRPIGQSSSAGDRGHPPTA